MKRNFSTRIRKLQMPSLPDNDQSCNPHLASLVAINIVIQVLDEAQDIVNSASELDQPWRYIWRQKKRNSGIYENAEILGVANSKIDERKLDHSNPIITSTPQKESDELLKGYNENALIGQGDEETQTRNADMQSPTMLTNCLFDMSDLEQAATFEVTEDVQLQNEAFSQDFLACSVTKFVESYIDLAINSACGDVVLPIQKNLFDYIEEKSCTDSAVDVVIHAQDVLNSIDKRRYSNSSCEDVLILGQDALNDNIDTSRHSVSVCEEILITEQQMLNDNIVESNYSSFSFLHDADSDFNGNVYFNSENLSHEEEKNSQTTQPTKLMDDFQKMEEIKKKDIDLYEKTFSTMNRDYDKCSEGDNFEEDLKNVTMQEVELSTKKKSYENLHTNSAQQCLKNKEKDVVASTPGTSTNKRGLVKRCRLQGARLLSRLRSWWWKQRLIGRRKGSRCGLTPGICPLSPMARNRAASLLDHRKLQSASPTRMVPWKYSTVNEAMIEAYDKKGFDLELNSSANLDE